MGSSGKMMMIRKKLLSGLPYSEEKLNGLRMPDIKMLGSALGVETWQKRKDEIIKGILTVQDDIEQMDERIDDFCEMCGNYVAIRQKAHIVAEGDKSRDNILMLCPSCHLMFDTRLKPRLYVALKKAKARYLPKSWEKSIYQHAAEAGLLRWIEEQKN
ncbi:MAG: hypothetical protein JRJ85_25540 [Deltaproteobacteria bacterium]|nr:hypothetical protein [Deltaproteobacteria bacterium]